MADTLHDARSNKPTQAARTAIACPCGRMLQILLAGLVANSCSLGGCRVAATASAIAPAASASWVAGSRAWSTHVSVVGPLRGALECRGRIGRARYAGTGIVGAWRWNEQTSSALRPGEGDRSSDENRSTCRVCPRGRVLVFRNPCTVESRRAVLEAAQPSTSTTSHIERTVCGRLRRPPARYRSVVVFAFENRTWSAVGAPASGRAMPYLHGLAEAMCVVRGLDRDRHATEQPYAIRRAGHGRAPTRHCRTTADLPCRAARTPTTSSARHGAPVSRRQLRRRRDAAVQRRRERRQARPGAVPVGRR